MSVFPSLDSQGQHGPGTRSAVSKFLQNEVDVFKEQLRSCGMKGGSIVSSVELSRRRS